MSSIEKIMSFVNRTFREAGEVQWEHLGKFAASAFLKLAFFYGILWVATRFVDISIK